MFLIIPPGTLCFQKIHAWNELKWYEKDPITLIFLAKIAKIHIWNELKWYKKNPISTQIFSAIKSNEQLLTGSQCRLGLCRQQLFYWAKILTQTMST